MISTWQQLSEHNIYKNEETYELLGRQQSWLTDCIRRNENTEFGRLHHFKQIRTIEDYRSNVPVYTYDELENFISKVEQGNLDVLFTGVPAAFERTSGSSRGQKLVPYSAESLFDFRKAILPWLIDLVKQYQITSGHAYWAISPATRQPEMTRGGIPIGLPDAAYLGEDVIPFFLNVSAVPHWVGMLTDIQDWQLATLYYLVCSEDLVLISVWSPTFLLSLLDALHTRKNELLNVLEHGIDLNGNILKPNSIAKKSLKQYFQTTDIKYIWPDLKVISCWADASSAPFYEALLKKLPNVSVQAKGLLLTEGVITVPNRHNQTTLAAVSGFYEFLDSDSTAFLANELVKGQVYEVVMTTSGGLYRYRTYDKVVCDGYQDSLPILHFIGRGNLTSDLVGEKLTDDFVRECLDGITGFSMLIPADNTNPGYLLILDKQHEQNTGAILEEVEHRLANNPHYAYARKLGQLQPLKPVLLDNPLALYLASPIHSDTRLGDIKVPSLCIKPGIFDAQIGAAA